jgi:uracil-DNA glycosylase
MTHHTCESFDPEEWECLCGCEEFPMQCDKCPLHSERDRPMFFGGYDPEEVCNTGSSSL